MTQWGKALAEQSWQPKFDSQTQAKVEELQPPQSHTLTSTHVNTHTHIKNNK